MADEVTAFDKWRAFGVHLLTASGAFLAFMSVIAAAEQRWVAMFGWLGFALFVDGIDGPLARRIEIKRVLPNWSGDLLDSIIDYATFVMIPAVALYLSGMIGRPWSFVAAALIVISSAIYYADLRMKTKDNFFRGFPVAWNMVVFTFFAIQPNEWTAFAFVVFCSAATFLPIKFLHPVRVERLRGVNLGVFAIWSVLGLAALFSDFAPLWWIKWGLVASGLYLFAIGGVLQMVDRLRGVSHD
ncbi:phosphatidylcholine/phosphatidylserine synthase [Aurantimonas sp. C2-6-R+9]|uniref:phosphatidylcholine synthase n=1 Tax=unclassified Aurantimonas TaxID=2638230 RepID=UPI002E17106B|nr:MULTISPECIES: phosphatidylcholine/phosphatidylserine synthase [unclassified Aurantimonas]MEC5290221.1 phosphatidylcholine/phosphatidylserine synthase [Aurantimonas sp. C2-3-R2]MEC5321717.1 phosphatidylcholine/phosphatidylserine synthase [Aurantimonas sp. A3-2-R12]MEC5380332.1 phosphatidylcholine/phosphatidylserine synthase [Aurantimonas sp. C2-6-R+9]MEC5411285.1 phosphatidylcholine/phosphatidylserine synthase [Aurantimonas sp. C2-4-R8]